MNKKIINYLLSDIILMFAFCIITYLCGFNYLIFFIFMFFLGLNTLSCFYKNYNKIEEYIVKYRWIIAIVIFAILVLFKISGSSIGEYNKIFSNKIYEFDSVIFGTSRAIRGDEHTVLTPYYFSQYYSGFSKISYMMSVTGQNMILGYNAPALDFTLLAKPLNWGYVLFGNEYGLSWYWCLKFILIFMGAFEFGYIITNKNFKLSLLAGIFVAIGPSTQWWFAPHMPDVILWAMLLFSCIYNLLETDKKLIKLPLCIFTPFILLQFTVALFPSFQVGLGYFIGIILIACLLKNKINIFRKSNILYLIIVSILSVILVGGFLYSNIDALKQTSNTIYPGHRVSLGGNYQAREVFTDLSTPFLSYKDNSPFRNQSEDSTYIHYGILCLMITPVLIITFIKEKKREWILGLAFFAISIICVFFMIVGFPNIIAKLTLFSYINRMKMIYGVISIFYTIWMLSNLKYIKGFKANAYFIICCLVYSVMLLFTINTELKNYAPMYVYYLEIIIYFMFMMFMKYGMEKTGYYLISSLVVFSSININPIITGASDIYNHPVSVEINKIVSADNESYWIGYGDFMLPSYLIANGAKTINAVNFYPDLKKWEILDPNNMYEEVWNRYCHIFTVISEKNTIVSNTNSADIIKLEISLKDMDRLNVKYILSPVDLSGFSNDEYSLKSIYSDSNCYIFELTKNNIEKKVKNNDKRK